MSRPTVFLVTDFWYPKFGGMERSIANLAGSLPRLFDAHVVTPRAGSVSRPWPFRVVPCEADGENGYYPAALEQIVSVKTHRIVHIFGFSYHWPAAQARFIEELARLARVSVVMKVPTLGDARRSLRSTHGNVIGKVDRFIALTEALLGELHTCGVNSERVVHVPNGVVTGWFSRPDERQRNDARRAWGLPLDKPVVGFCGRFEERKRIDLLAEALSAIDPRDRPYLILVGATDRTFGAGVDVSPLLDEHVRLIPEQSDMRPVYHAMDVYASASTMEGMSNAILEAMASGLPIVASDIPGHRELVSHERNGMLFRSGDALELETAFRRIVAAWHTPERHRWGACSRQRAVAEFDQEPITRRYAEMYLGLAQMRPDPRKVTCAADAAKAPA